MARLMMLHCFMEKVQENEIMSKNAWLQIIANYRVHLEFR